MSYHKSLQQNEGKVPFTANGVGKGTHLAPFGLIEYKSYCLDLICYESHKQGYQTWWNTRLAILSIITSMWMRSMISHHITSLTHFSFAKLSNFIFYSYTNVYLSLCKCICASNIIMYELQGWKILQIVCQLETMLM